MKKTLFLLIIIAALNLVNLSAFAQEYRAISTLINDAIEYHNKRNYVLSIRSFKQALDLDPSNKQIRENLSIVHNNYGKYLAERTDQKGAAREFRNALFFNSGNEVARSNLDVKVKSMGLESYDYKVRLEESRKESDAGNLYAAIAEAREANRIKETPMAHLEIGDAYHILYVKGGKRTEYAKQAISSFERMIELNKKDVTPLIRLGNIYIAKKEVNQAIDYYQQAIKQEPENLEAQEALINGWLTAVRVAPHIASNHVGLATAYQIQGNYKQSERGFRKALQIDPNSKFAKEGLSSLEKDKKQQNLRGHLEKAVAFQKERRYEESLREYLQALNLDPNNPDLHYNIGTAFQAKNDMERAKRAYKKTLEIDSRHKEAKAALQNILAKEKDAQVAKAVENAINLQSGHRYEEAISAYQEILKQRPKDDAIYFNIGTAYQKLGKFDDAIENYKKASSLKNDPAYQEAIEDVRIEKVNWLLEKGIAAQNNGENKIAIRMYKEIVEIVPNNASAWYNLGTAYQAEKKVSDALDAYEKAYTIDAESQSDAIFFSAIIMEEKRKLNDAISLYEKYLSAAPNGPYAKDAKERQEYIKSFL